MRWSIGVLLPLGGFLALVAVACGNDNKAIFSGSGSGTGGGGSDISGGTSSGSGGGGDAGSQCAEDDQVVGDCQVAICDDAGGMDVEGDDSDIPNDDDPCTVDRCENGVPSNTLASPGTPCGDGVCDDAGDCVECNTAQDCPGDDTTCQTRICNEKLCGFDFSAQGTALTLQTAGDCKTSVCDGAGATTTITEADDVPDDFNVCTLDSCDGSTPTHSVSVGANCGATGMCNDAGQCIGCSAPSDCPGEDDFCKQRTCQSNVCGFAYTSEGSALPADNQVPRDCQKLVCNGAGDSESVADDLDLPAADDSDCTQQICVAGDPEFPPVEVGTKCAQGGGSVCSTAGECVECNGPLDCADPMNACLKRTCASNECGVAEVEKGAPCGAASCSAAVQQLPDQCDGSGSCTDAGSVDCAPYACAGSACGDSCLDRGGCAAGYVCNDAGKCVDPPSCEEYCETIFGNCTDAEHAQYNNNATCLGSCGHLPPGLPGAASGNSIGCRITHAGFASEDAHCYHAGPGGAGTCGTDCDGFCAIALRACRDTPSAYTSQQQCLTECRAFPNDASHSINSTGDNLACRLHHLTLATAGATATHCAHMRESSGVCVDPMPMPERYRPPEH